MIMFLSLDFGFITQVPSRKVEKKSLSVFSNRGMFSNYASESGI